MRKRERLQPPVVVRRAHHRNLDALIAQSSETSGPLSVDRGSLFELKAALAKKLNRRSKVIDDDSYVIHLTAVTNRRGTRSVGVGIMILIVA